MKTNRVGSVRIRSEMALLFGGLLLLAAGAAGCKEKNPLQDLLNKLVSAAKANDRGQVEALVDAESRLGLYAVKVVLGQPKEKQNEMFEKLKVQLLAKSEEQLKKIKGEIADRVLTKHKDALASGKCQLAAPKPEDQQAVLFPKLPPDSQSYMNPDLGRVIFNLKSSVANSIAARVKCGDDKEFFFHAFQKKSVGGETPPWSILFVSE
jgi:hypothetical protein